MSGSTPQSFFTGTFPASIAVASVIVIFGMNLQFVSLTLQQYGERLLGPFLVLCGIFLLGTISLDRLPGGDRISGLTSGLSARLAEKGYLGAFLLGVVFALSFCPFSAVLFFAMFIPLAIDAGDPVIIPAVFAHATGLPVIVISFLLAQDIGKCKGMIQKIGAAELWIRRVVAAVFLIVGIYYSVKFFLPGRCRSNHQYRVKCNSPFRSGNGLRVNSTQIIISRPQPSTGRRSTRQTPKGRRARSFSSGPGHQRDC